jgi:hypothetical protein
MEIILDSWLLAATTAVALLIVWDSGGGPNGYS